MPLPPVPSLQDSGLEEYLKAFADALERDVYQPLGLNGGVGVNQAAVDSAIQASEASQEAQFTQALGVVAPPGLIAAWCGATAPTGWLLCQGQQVAKDTYPALYTLLGATFGPETTTHFTLPDLQGRVPRGAASLVPRGSTGGGEEQSVGLATHSHDYNDQSTNLTEVDAGLGGVTVFVVGSLSVVPAATTPTGAGGDPQTFSVLDPYLALNWIIKT